MYSDANNLHGWAMSEKFPVDGFKWIKKVSKFSKHFIKNYDENGEKGYFVEVHVEYPKNLIFKAIYCLYLKEIKLKNVTSLFVTYKTKKTMSFT